MHISAKSVSRSRVVDEKSAIGQARFMFKYSDEEMNDLSEPLLGS
jgi:hypothetical protein